MQNLASPARRATAFYGGGESSSIDGFSEDRTATSTTSNTPNFRKKLLFTDEEMEKEKEKEKPQDQEEKEIKGKEKEREEKQEMDPQRKALAALEKRLERERIAQTEIEKERIGTDRNRSVKEGPLPTTPVPSLPRKIRTEDAAQYNLELPTEKKEETASTDNAITSENADTSTNIKTDATSNTEADGPSTSRNKSLKPISPRKTLPTKMTRDTDTSNWPTSLHASAPNYKQTTNTTTTTTTTTTATTKALTTNEDTNKPTTASSPVSGTNALAALLLVDLPGQTPQAHQTFQQSPTQTQQTPTYFSTPNFDRIRSRSTSRGSKGSKGSKGGKGKGRTRNIQIDGSESTSTSSSGTEGGL